MPLRATLPRWTRRKIRASSRHQHQPDSITAPPRAGGLHLIEDVARMYAYAAS
jgi:hypothetical protein